MFEDSVTIVLDKERHLKLTLGGMKQFREATGIDLLKGAIGDIFNLSEGISLLLFGPVCCRRIENSLLKMLVTCLMPPR